MSTTYGATGLGQTAASTRRVSSFFKRYWGAFQERRKRQRLRATLCDLSDRELMDIGTTRGEIDYVASNRLVDRSEERRVGKECRSRWYPDHQIEKGHIKLHLTVTDRLR